MINIFHLAKAQIYLQFIIPRVVIV